MAVLSLELSGLRIVLILRKAHQPQQTRHGAGKAFSSSLLWACASSIRGPEKMNETMSIKLYYVVLSK